MTRPLSAPILVLLLAGCAGGPPPYPTDTQGVYPGTQVRFTQKIEVPAEWHRIGFQAGVTRQGGYAPGLSEPDCALAHGPTSGGGWSVGPVSCTASAVQHDLNVVARDFFMRTIRVSLDCEGGQRLVLSCESWRDRMTWLQEPVTLDEIARSLGPYAVLTPGPRPRK